MTNPIANRGQFLAESDVLAMRADPRVSSTRAIIEMLFARGYSDRMPVQAKPLLSAFADEFLNNWLFKAAASDAQHPKFVRDFMPAYRWPGQVADHEVVGSRTGGDNPDNCYRLAGIEHGTAYRIIGRLPAQPDAKAANISFTLTANYGTSQTVQTVEDHELAIAPDGWFDLTIDDKPANGRANHLTTSPGTRFLFVRDSMMDWARETPLDLQIERIGEARTAPLTTQDMATRAIEHALNDLYLYFWFQNIWSGMALNSITQAEAMRGSGGGLVTQGICNGTFDLGPDDAAVITYDPVDAGYAAVQLTEWLYRSLDYHRIQSSLTAAQSHVDADGLVRVVIARRDPGIANWLDTGGQSRVHSILRWQRMKPDGRPIKARLTLTTIDRLRHELPVGTLWVETAERKSRLENRVAAYRRRITA
ncbi:hypothetical protein HGI47_18015 [Novosphingobium sp. ERN07]|uniref:hypothetical protein n=1 Tax=Novosphingobium sp. ERN07 TaxID=2726187 RepID=UPI0014578C51|nr:hypothetical protein [Novosphingobium sp. ERN07]NLR72773.1 hypothetical protein [Novosphingobium sp. ERN07]